MSAEGQSARSRQEMYLADLMAEMTDAGYESPHGTGIGSAVTKILPCPDCKIWYAYRCFWKGARFRSFIICHCGAFEF